MAQFSNANAGNILIQASEQLYGYNHPSLMCEKFSEADISTSNLILPC